MHSQLRDLADIHYGKSPAEVLTHESAISVIGTGGAYGCASRAMHQGPAVVVPRKGSLGNPQFVDKPFWAADTTYAVIPKGNVNAKWLYYSLASFDLTKLNEATGVPSISRDWLSRISLNSAEADSQHRIAEILSTIDETIEATEALIAKHQKIKAGLMRDLFTRGVTPDGHFRPTHEQAPDLYKESLLGWIPLDWEVLQLVETIEHIWDFRGRTPLKLDMTWGGEIPALSAMNVKMGEIDLSLETHFGSESLYHRWMTSGDLQCGDVILTMEAPLGNVAQIPNNDKYILSQRVIGLRFKESLAENIFMSWLFRSARFQHDMARRSSGTTATGIQRAQLVPIPVAIPPRLEQLGILSVLDCIQEKLVAELAILAKLRQEKVGLMQDLLTGRVRVNVGQLAQ